MEDPLVEAVFDDLDPEDKTEFPEVGEAIKDSWGAAGQRNDTDASRAHAAAHRSHHRHHRCQFPRGRARRSSMDQ